MSELANSYLSAYQGQVGDIQSQLNDLLDKDSIAFQAKEKANEVVEAVGSIKAFMGGQPVGKYLLAKGKAFIKDSGITKEGAEADAEGEPEGTIAGEGEIPNPAFDPTSISSSEGIPDMLASKSEALASNYGESSTIAETSFGEGLIPQGAGVVQGGALEATLQGGRGLSAAEASSFTESSSGGVLSGETSLIGSVSKVVKETASISKSLAGAEGGEVAEGGGELAGEEAVAGALDEVPIVGIISLIAGAGLAIGAAIKKPKFTPPVDNVNASYQVGI